nr:hypothetical protein [Tanacetum cinerariifolium]
SQTMLNEQMTQLKSMCEIFCQSVQKKLKEKRIEEEQAAKAQSWKFPVCYDDDDDEEGYDSLNDNIIFELPPYSAVTPTEPIDSLSMGDEHLNTIPTTKSDEFIKNLFCKRLLYDNSSPRPPEEIVSENSNADIESFSPSPIPNKDSDSHMEEIDLYFNPDDPKPPSIKEDDDDSERDISILEKLLNNYSLSLHETESYHFDIPSPYRPPAKPPDGNRRTLNIKMMGDISKRKPSAECPMILNGKNIPLLDVPLFHFYPIDQFKYGRN